MDKKVSRMDKNRPDPQRPGRFFYFFASITQNPPERSSFSTEA